MKAELNAPMQHHQHWGTCVEPVRGASSRYTLFFIDLRAGRRDVKPANIPVTWNGNTLLADFGIAVSQLLANSGDFGKSA